MPALNKVSFWLLALALAVLAAWRWTSIGAVPGKVPVVRDRLAEGTDAGIFSK